MSHCLICPIPPPLLAPRPQETHCPSPGVLDDSACLHQPLASAELLSAAAKAADVFEPQRFDVDWARWVRGRGSKPVGSHFGGFVNSPPILEPILVGIGMFTGGTILI